MTKSVHYEHLITPETAAVMLKTSAGNRTLRTWHVTALADAIKRGEWRLTHQGLAFDSAGRLRDGHHRLNAIIQAGIAVPMLVSDNMDPESFYAVDQGVNRTLSDVTGMDRRVSEVVKLAVRVATGNGRTSIPQCEAIAEFGVADETARLVEHCGTCREFFSSAPVRLAAVYTILRGGPAVRGFVHGQYHALVHQDFDKMNPLSKALTRQVSNGVASAKHSFEAFHRGVTVFNAANSHRERVLATAEMVDATIGEARQFFLRALPASVLNAPQPVLDLAATRTQARRAANEFLGV